jgi:hypothetical protein
LSFLPHKVSSGSKVLPRLEHGHVYRLLREYKGLTRQDVAASVSPTALRRGKRFHAPQLGQIENGQRPVPEGMDETLDSVRDELDLRLALGDEQASDDLVYTLAWRAQTIELIRPARGFRERDHADAAAHLLSALGTRTAVVVPVWSSYIHERRGRVLESAREIAKYVGAVVRSNNAR